MAGTQKQKEYKMKTIEEQLLSIGLVPLNKLKIDITDYKFKIVGEFENELTNKYNKFQFGKLTLNELKNKIESKINQVENNFSKNNFGAKIKIDYVTISLFINDKEFVGSAIYDCDETGYSISNIYIKEKNLKK